LFTSKGVGYKIWVRRILYSGENMPEEIDILKLICDRLETGNFSYMLTGSLAANFYAVPRMTRDIDVVIEIIEPDVRNFSRTFEKDFYLSEVSINEAIKHESIFNIIHNETIIKIDFVVRKESTYRNIEFKRRRRMELDGIGIWIVSPEDLIISKLLWAKDSLSELQLRDIKNLFASVKDLDKKYIEEWVKTLHLDAIYEKARNSVGEPIHG
jgi:hypothetical protein